LRVAHGHPVKILISACYFTPDPIGGGKFTGEMAEWLVARGHQVRAVVAVPFYPQWKAAPGYSPWMYKFESVRGVNVLRCPIYIPSRASGLRRLLQYAVFALTSTPVLWAWSLWRRPDIVWTMMPPLAGMIPALAAAKLGGARSWLHVQDFEIDAAFELGILRSPGLKRFFLGAERKLMSAFDRVSSITPRMVEQLDVKRVTALKILFPNWVDLDAIYPIPHARELRDELEISQEAFVALYSGNLGEKQGVDDLVDVARLLADVPNFTMVVCGDGVGRARLATRAQALSNIRFLPLQPIERFNQLLGMADTHLLPQKPEVADLVMPSKLPGMLASGRPVIAGAKPGTQLSREVEGCGLVVEPGDPQAMAAAVRHLMADSLACQILGGLAADRARERWTKEAVLSRFEAELTALTTYSR
jgi:colanic acid biosynthesis glycosyl transferase WcaI